MSDNVKQLEQELENIRQHVGSKQAALAAKFDERASLVNVSLAGDIDRAAAVAEYSQMDAALALLQAEVLELKRRQQMADIAVHDQVLADAVAEHERLRKGNRAIVGQFDELSDKQRRMHNNKNGTQKDREKLAADLARVKVKVQYSARELSLAKGHMDKTQGDAEKVRKQYGVA